MKNYKLEAHKPIRMIENTIETMKMFKPEANRPTRIVENTIKNNEH